MSLKFVVISSRVYSQLITTLCTVYTSAPSFSSALSRNTLEQQVGFPSPTGTTSSVLFISPETGTTRLFVRIGLSSFFIQAVHRTPFTTAAVSCYLNFLHLTHFNKLSLGTAFLKL